MLKPTAPKSMIANVADLFDQKAAGLPEKWIRIIFLISYTMLIYPTEVA